MDSGTSMIRYIIGASRIKYEVLDYLYAPINTSPYRMGVMYVDAHSIFYRLYRPSELSTMYADTKEEVIRDLVIGFLNVIGHYRRYMSTRLKLDNDIYVVFNRKQPKYNSTYCSSFNSKYDERYDTSSKKHGFINSALEAAWSFICGLSPYFEGIYCIDNQGIDDFAVMHKLGFHDEIFYTIFSRSMYGTQLLRPNVVQLYNSRDKSRLITYDSCYKNGVLFDRKQTAHQGLTPGMLPLLWCFAGCSDVSIPRVKYISGIVDMVKYANMLIGLGELKDGVSIQSFLDSIGSVMKKGEIRISVDRPLLENRYKALSVPLASTAITSDQTAKIASQCYDLFAETELEQLNDLLLVGGFDNPELLEIDNLNMSHKIVYSY